LTFASGVCIGLNAAMISIVTEWLSTIKFGYCADGWWLSQQFCCWEIEGDDIGACHSWHLWSSFTLARWLIYVLFAVRFRSIPLFRGADALEHTDPIFFCGRLSRSLYSEVCGRFGDIRDQVYPGWVRYARISWFCYICCEKYYIGKLTVQSRYLHIFEYPQPLVIASGLSVGKEGPSVHVACCIGYLVASLFGKFSRSQGKPKRIALLL
jgi:chloride channel 3/4/5